MLQTTVDSASVVSAPTQFGARISLRKSQGAQAPTERFFCVCVLVGRAGALSGAPLPCSGKANPVRSISSSLASGGGGNFPYLYKEAVMAALAHIQNLPTMSSREIAEICNARHADVVTTIKRLQTKNLLRESRKSPKLVASGGRPYHVYELTKRDSLLVVSGYKDEIRAALIDRWMELESKEQPAQLSLAFSQTIANYIELTAVRMANKARSQVEAYLLKLAREAPTDDPKLVIAYIEKHHKGATPKFFLKHQLDHLDVMLALVMEEGAKVQKLIEG